MSAGAKVAAFVLAIAAAAGGGAALGAAVGPIDVGGEPAHEQDAPHGGSSTRSSTVPDDPTHTTDTTHGDAGGHSGWGH